MRQPDIRRVFAEEEKELLYDRGQRTDIKADQHGNTGYRSNNQGLNQAVRKKHDDRHGYTNRNKNMLS